MPALNPTRQNALILVALLFGQLLLMAGSARGDRDANMLETGLMRATRPLVGVASGAGDALRGAFTGVRRLLGAHAENEQLRVRVRQLETELAQTREQVLENPRLRRLLGMRETLAPQSIGASVVTAILTDQDKLIVIDRGTADGVHADLPVIAWGGAVGRVVSAGTHLAKVRLLDDPSSRIAGVVQRSRVEGMVHGRGDEPLEMRYVPRFSDVMLEDRVVTSGREGVFPRGVGIGTVGFVGDDAGISKQVRLRPAVDPHALEEVLVLLEPVGSRLLDAADGGGGS